MGLCSGVSCFLKAGSGLVDGGVYFIIFLRAGSVGGVLVLGIWDLEFVVFFLGDGLFLGMGLVLFFLRAGDACRCSSVWALLVFFLLLSGGVGSSH